MTPEAKLYQRMRAGIATKANINRIESRVGLGLPDCLVAIQNHGFLLVELKVVTSGKKVKLSPHQVSFHLKHALMGCPTFVLVEYHPPKTSGKKPQILLYEGKMVEDIVTLGVEAKTALAADLTPQCWDNVFNVFCQALK